MLLKKLNTLKTNNVLLNEMQVFDEGRIVRVGLEYTIYDYDCEPVLLIDMLNKNGYAYDWYNSVEIHIVK